MSLERSLSGRSRQVPSVRSLSAVPLIARTSAAQKDCSQHGQRHLPVFRDFSGKIYRLAVAVRSSDRKNKSGRAS